jgi:protein tyrosine/serine phosphatase
MGKDRTGVIVGLLLSLAGVSHETIAAEFILTEAHLEHLQPKIAEIVRSIDPEEKDPWEIAKIATECRSVPTMFRLKIHSEGAS